MFQNEKRAILSLSLIMSFRMLGMFMILPVFSLYALTQLHASPTQIGIALGIYGLTQACLQIPLGSLSDKIGRKKIIFCGLTLFALGSLIAAFAHSIQGIIIGRAIQGAGAIGSTVLATVADLTRDENRSKAMATLGLTIGLSFAIALIAGPIINHWFQLQGIFLTTFLLAMLAIIMLITIVPNPSPIIAVESSTRYQGKQAWKIIKNPQLLRLNMGIFSLHGILTATFIATPILLTHTIQLTPLAQALLYIVVLSLAFMLMLPFIIIGEKKRQLKPFFITAIIILALCQATLLTQTLSFLLISLVLILFFTAFTFLEASLPSLVSKISPIKRKGTAMGIYSSAQFMGIFMGGSFGGLLFDHFQLTGLFLFCTLLALLWLLAASSMAAPPYLSTYLFKINAHQQQHIEKIKQFISQQDGVSEVLAAKKEQLIYVKADSKIIHKDQLRKAINECNLEQ